jgi:tRNA1(Val) A37 N6-methylase TrmN6
MYENMRKMEVSMLFTMDDFAWDEIIIHSIPSVWPPSVFGRQLATVISKISFSQKTVLDVGCGSGIQGIVAAKRGATVSASDISPSAIECTSLNASSAEVAIETRIGPGIDLWAGKKFDVVICNGPTFESPLDGDPQHPGNRQRLVPIPSVLVDILNRHDDIINDNGRIIGLVCGPYCFDLIQAVAADCGLCIDFIKRICYTGYLEGFGGSFDATTAIQTGLAEPISEGKILIRGTIFAFCRASDMGYRKLDKP